MDQQSTEETNEPDLIAHALYIYAHDKMTYKPNMTRDECFTLATKLMADTGLRSVPTRSHTKVDIVFDNPVYLVSTVHTMWGKTFLEKGQEPGNANLFICVTGISSDRLKKIGNEKPDGKNGETCLVGDLSKPHIVISIGNPRIKQGEVFALPLVK